ncbi:hypothetical protein J7K28_04095 [Candidatus Aerophobetes bacterium]|nr:hypothetical protein [Candidatus Aerophobetes bacterium]
MRKMKGILSVLLITLVLFSGGSLLADDTSQTILCLKKAILQLQNKSELGFRNFYLCSVIKTLGDYAPLPEPKIKKDGELLLYFEPANLYTRISERKYEFWFIQDAILTDKEGKEIWSKEGFLEMHYITSTPVLDVYVHNTLGLGGLSPGKYVYTVILHDRFRNKSAKKSVEFEIIE